MKCIGKNGRGETLWILTLPEQAAPGVEMGVVVSIDGVEIGGETLTWRDIDVARVHLCAHIADAFDAGERAEQEERARLRQMNPDAPSPMRTNEKAEK